MLLLLVVFDLPIVHSFGEWKVVSRLSIQTEAGRLSDVR